MNLYCMVAALSALLAALCVEGGTYGAAVLFGLASFYFSIQAKEVPK